MHDLKIPFIQKLPHYALFFIYTTFSQQVSKKNYKNSKFLLVYIDRPHFLSIYNFMQF